MRIELAGLLILGFIQDHGHIAGHSLHIGVLETYLFPLVVSIDLLLQPIIALGEGLDLTPEPLDGLIELDTALFHTISHVVGEEGLVLVEFHIPLGLLEELFQPLFLTDVKVKRFEPVLSPELIILRFECLHL